MADFFSISLVKVHLAWQGGRKLLKFEAWNFSSPPSLMIQFFRSPRKNLRAPLLLHFLCSPEKRALDCIKYIYRYCLQCFILWQTLDPVVMRCLLSSQVFIVVECLPVLWCLQSNLYDDVMCWFWSIQNFMSSPPSPTLFSEPPYWVSKNFRSPPQYRYPPLVILNELSLLVAQDLWNCSK